MTAARPHGARRGEPASGDARAKGRELALLALCHLESYPAAEHAEALALLWRNVPRGDDERGHELTAMVEDAQARRRADALVRGIIERSSELDAAITATSLRWRLDRMNQIDRNLLRLAAYELLARSDTPRGVVLAEAVRLARRYGSEQSPGFVNGIAEGLAKRLRAPTETAPEPKRSPTAAEADD